MMHVKSTSDGISTKYTLSNKQGTSLVLSSHGATICSVLFPDKHGVLEEVTLFSPTQVGPYYGVTVGRVANRIAHGKMTIDGKHYTLAVNNGENHLHGGMIGFDKVEWKHKVEQNEVDGGTITVVFSHVSIDGDEGYPGTLHIEVMYSLNSRSDIHMQYKAWTNAPTVVNITNHTYWNLSGNCRATVLTHRLQVFADNYLPVNEHQIPTGELRSVRDTPFDLCNGVLLSEVVPLIDGGGQPGLDHCFAIRSIPADDDPRLPVMAVLEHDASGRRLTVRGSQPGVQVYTANFLSGPPPFTQHAAVCLETQHFPDAVNQPHFASIILRPGETYYQEAIFSLTNF